MTDASFDWARRHPHSYKIGVAKRLDGHVEADRPYYFGPSPAYCACAFSTRPGRERIVQKRRKGETEKRRKGEKKKKSEGEKQCI